MKIMKNEEGFVLPLMIAITFVSAYLLMMLATQIEIRVASYERTRTYMKMNLLEHEGLMALEYFLSTTRPIEDFAETWMLRNRHEMLINGIKREEIFDFFSKLCYNS